MNRLKLIWLALGCLLSVLVAGVAYAVSATGPASESEGQASQAPQVSQAPQAPKAPEGQMNNARLGALLLALDPELSGRAGNWVVTFNETSAQILTDERANRMRIMIPIADAKDLDADALYRMLQANYESALDARYAVAQGLVWVTYLHPLSMLTRDELLLALAQTYNAAETYGTSYSSGLFQFGGGDNRSEIFDDILKRGTQL